MSEFYGWMTSAAPVSHFAGVVGVVIVLVGLVEWVRRAVGSSGL